MTKRIEGKRINRADSLLLEDGIMILRLLLLSRRSRSAFDRKIEGKQINRVYFVLL